MTPRAEETLVRLASWMPCAAAQELLDDLLGVQVSKATARRATEAAGEAALAVCEQEEERLKQEPAPAPKGAEKQALSGDGAFVHLVGGAWVEVKSLTIAEVTANAHGEVELEQISTFPRLLEAERFAEAALVETQRRGVDQATAVCAVQDGAVWLQGLVDYHRADAVRILDFPHAAEYVNAIGQAVQAAGGHLPVRWLEGMLHRLKGAGMRWQDHNVNPMLVLRNAVCNRRWQETWMSARAHRVAQSTQQRRQRSQQRLVQACWTVVYWARVQRAHSSVQPTAESVAAVDPRPRAARPGAGYSWRQPFLRRPPSVGLALGGGSAKK